MDIMKQPYKTDVAVLLLFFNRPDTFQLVFDAVREARPSRLFLYQDGARAGNAKDEVGVAACREIVSDEKIDWQCEVHRHYCTENQGCDPSEYLSQKWAFSIVDKCIVLEDDDVPSPSFFPLCKELLDRYEHDNRVWMIAGFNSDEVTRGVVDDYFFTSVFSIWGWASWRRVIDTWDTSYSFLDDKQTMEQLHTLIRQRRWRSDFITMCRDHRASGKAYYETIFWASMILNNGLAIMPTRNMINNMGVTADSTHFSANLNTIPRRLRRMFTMRRYEVQFPLRHPHYMLENVAYKESVYRANAWGHPLIKIGYSLEELFRNLRYGNFTHIGRSLRRRIRKWTGREKHF